MADNSDWPEPYGYCEHLRPHTGVDEINPFNMYQGAKDILRAYKIMRQCYHEIAANSSVGDGFYSPKRWVHDFAYFYNGDFFEVGLLIAATISWGIFSYIFMDIIFKSIPELLGVFPVNSQKLTVSAHKLTSNFFMWLYIMYITCFGSHKLISEPFHVFADWQLRNHPLDLKIAYFLEASYYFHALYHTLFVEEKRKDTLVMVMHHFVTLALIVGSYLMGYLKIGILIFFLDDTSDVLLELGKSSTYLINTKFGYSKIADVLSQIFACLFALSWLVFRVIFHVSLVWRLASLGTIAYLPVAPVPFFFILNLLIGCLYVFYCYWFWFIIRFVLLIVTKQMPKIVDCREHENGKKEN